MPRQTKKAEAQARKLRFQHRHVSRMDRLRLALRTITKGVCPECGTKLYRNNSLGGWWQCGHVGAEGFQREAGPHCHYQTFFEPTPDEHAELLAEKQEALPIVCTYRVTTKIPYHNFVKTFTNVEEMHAWVYHGTGVNLPLIPEAAFLGRHKTARNEGEVTVERVSL